MYIQKSLSEEVASEQRSVQAIRRTVDFILSEPGSYWQGSTEKTSYGFGQMTLAVIQRTECTKYKGKAEKVVQ